ncbi:VOC family protein [Microbulbifer sp. OS29]|uniref:VOC family protein n=1 Tax=Microbulbifer okhotskensis TaxID=2926617 RepID=A0A9X2J845_9GAMM|nr:VOC family protein [Microbulbifer okhotskensis]MCO1336480.1 VOC family protein [Microbulbifer okhotskensis]
MELDHVNITAPMETLKQVRNFYTQILGLTEGERPNFKRAGFWLYGNGRAILHLIEGEVSGEQPDKPYLDHIAFRAEALEPIKQRLDRLGITSQQMDVPGRPLRQLVFFDPVGVKVEVNARD